MSGNSFKNYGVKAMSRFFKLMDEDRVIVLEYPMKSMPRYGHGNPPHQMLYRIIDENRAVYKENLKGFLKFKTELLRIDATGPDTEKPVWINGWIPGLDSIALYSFLSVKKPKLYLEVGSGNSTKFARRAVSDHNLPTRILSIDPHPRANIDSICDTVIRKSLETVDLKVFDALEAGDILYLDGSHYSLANSDATVAFLEIIPRLKPGILVQIHDIFLPYDYPPEWKDRYYSEQYLLAAYILAGGNRFKIILPNAFISEDRELAAVLDTLWSHKEMNGVERHGVSFWIETA